MILRRLASAIRRQDWFTVVIETLIVVFGVFIGLQVNNWNEARQERIRSAAYTERLRSDLAVELEYANALRQYNETTLAAGRAAYAGLTDRAEMDAETLLINAYRASQYNWYERRRAAFDEIVASGALDLVSDPAVRDTAVGVYSTQIFDILLEEGQNAKYRELFRMTVEPHVHDALGRDCGDRTIENRGQAVGLIDIDYACKLMADADDIALAVSALRDDPEVARALRLRNAQTAGRVGDIDLITQTLGLQALFADEPAP